MPDTKLQPKKKQKCGHVNTTNCNSYLTISCIKLVIQVRKKLKFRHFISSF